MTDLPFRVEAWDAHEAAIEELLAIASNGLVGRGAFDAAIAQYPKRIITLRSGARVVQKHCGGVLVDKAPET